QWLPHTSASHRGGSADLMAFRDEDIRNLMGVLSQEIDSRQQMEHPTLSPHLLLIIDGPQLVEMEAVYSTLLNRGSAVGASVICLVGSVVSIPGDCHAIIDVGSDNKFRFAQVGPSGFEVFGDSDQLTNQEAEGIARALASLALRDTSAAGRIPRRVDFLELYG